MALLFIYFNAFIYLFIYFWLRLCCCARALSSCGKRGPLFIAVHRPLTIAASLVAEHRLQTLRLSSCGSRAQLLRGMWDLPRPGLEPVSPALAGGFSTTAPPGKPMIMFYTQRNLSNILVGIKEHFSGYVGHKVVHKVCHAVLAERDLLAVAPKQIPPNLETSFNSHGHLLVFCSSWPRCADLGQIPSCV